MSSFKYKCVTVDAQMKTPDKNSLNYTTIQFQVLLNQMITKGNYIKHRSISLGNGLVYHEILMKPEAGE